MSQTPVDVAIVGGGACGLTVVCQLFKRIKEGRGIRSITIIEKRESVGPGLACYEACNGCILNMHPDTMGLQPGNPLQFSQWMKETCQNLPKDSFPTRQQYGSYLKFLVEDVIQDAKSLGVKFLIINSEVVDLYRTGDFLELVLADGNKLHAYDTVLALGNFCASSHTEFNSNLGYYKCPWPNEKLQSIPTNAPVFILGSRLTAIDAANSLVNNGHEGPITFISRSGRLPKVQGPRAFYHRRYALHSLARELEENPTNALLTVMNMLRTEIEANATTDLSELTAICDPLTTLRSDIIQAEKGLIPWQPVLVATKPVIERYWKYMTSEEKIQFLRSYNSIWAIYRHSIPLENARKMLRLLEKGQLQVVRGNKAKWDDSQFVIHSGGKEICADFLIEALGQEVDVSKIQSPLLQQCLKSKLLKSHPVGGISVDFDTLEAAKNIYLIGSLTRGVHFYTNAIDRIKAHSSRVADSLTGLTVHRQLHVALFVESDIFSHLMISKLVPLLLDQGHMPFIFQISDWVNAEAMYQPFLLQEFVFFERTLLQDYIIPFVGSRLPKGAAFMTVEQLKAEYGVLVKKIPDINSLNILQALEENHIDIGISLGSSQLFNAKVIQHLPFPHPLLNLQPGLLPEYEGANPMIRAMMNGEKEFGYILYRVAEESNLMPDILDIRSQSIDYSKAMLNGIEDFYEIGVEMVSDVVERFARGKSLQQEQFGKYGSNKVIDDVRSEKSLKNDREKDFRLVDVEEMKKFFVMCFAGEGEELKGVIEGATTAWYKEFL